MAANSNVIARLTVSRANGWRTIVEIEATASFHNFYRFYRQYGARRSTKEFIRSASRNEGIGYLNAHLKTPGLDVIEKQLQAFGARSNPVVSTKLRIIKKRAYKRLITVSPSELGLSKVNTMDMSHRQRIPLPAELVPAKRRYSVLNGWSR